MGYFMRIINLIDMCVCAIFKFLFEFYSIKVKFLNKANVFVRQAQLVCNSSLFNKHKRQYGTVVQSNQYRSFSKDHDDGLQTKAKPKKVTIKVC
jgi:hypothetical protein